MTDWEVVIGLEVHAELATASKMFCACPTVDVIQAQPNTAVCPVCLGLPGALPVVNRRAVELGARAALALGCEVQPYSIFARKNYFYPDLPKGYQISQYETPLAVNGKLEIKTSAGTKVVRVHRAHLEEDTGKLTHVNAKGDSYSLVDLNRAGVPLLEIVSEPDMHSIEEAKAYAMGIHRILRYIEVSSCDMEKGAIRFEANISIRPVGSDVLNTRTEIKNLNSFRALERSLAYEIQRQIQVVEGGGRVIQETVGWNDLEGVTFSQRSKEEAHDYRYFPEPDLPPLVIEPEWLAEIKAGMVELPDAKQERFIRQYGLSEYDARLLVEDKAVAAYFEQVVAVDAKVSPKSAANWINGEWISCLNQSGKSVAEVKVTPQSLAELTLRVAEGKINLNTAKQVFGEMFKTGKSADEIIREKGLVQITDNSLISELIAGVIKDHPEEVASYLAGKETLANWFFGQVMARAKGQASPAVIRAELEQQLARLKTV
jgi:aspartyl-tRNA(Asn)/glutamyl-tRNA(Gln) amidotransferase subunit B